MLSVYFCSHQEVIGLSVMITWEADKSLWQSSITLDAASTQYLPPETNHTDIRKEGCYIPEDEHELCLLIQIYWSHVGNFPSMGCAIVCPEVDWEAVVGCV